MIDWERISCFKAMTEQDREEIRAACLADLHAQGARAYALGLCVFILGIDSRQINDVYIHFIPSIKGAGNWVVTYQDQPVPLMPSVRGAFMRYLQTEARFEKYLKGEIPSNGAVLPLFVSTSHKTEGSPLKTTYFIFRDCLRRIGYDGKWLKLPDLQILKA